MRTAALSTDGVRIVRCAAGPPVVEIASVNASNQVWRINVGPGVWRAAVSRIAALSLANMTAALRVYDLASGRLLASHALPLPLLNLAEMTFYDGTVTVFDRGSLQFFTVPVDGQPGPVRTLRGPSAERALRRASTSSLRLLARSSTGPAALR